MSGAALPHVVFVCAPSAAAEARAAYPEATVRVFDQRGLLDEGSELSAHGHAVVDAARGAAAVLVAWQLGDAPAINTLGYHVRAQAQGPLIGVVAAEADVPACLAAGTDAAYVGMPPWPYVQACALAYHRLVEAIRHARGRAPEPAGEQQFGALRIDPATHRFYVHGVEVVLTPREFALVDYLIRHAGTLRTRQQILDEVWGITFDTGTNMVDVYMHFLRRKLEARGLTGVIETVRGYGYRLVAAA